MRKLLLWYGKDPVFNAIMTLVVLLLLLPMVFIAASMCWYLVYEIVTRGLF